MSDTPPGSFLDELKRRKVVRVALVYGAVAFAVIEAADVIFPRVSLAEWTVTLVVWLAILGFPLALTLGWAFDVTPEGVKQTSLEQPAEPGGAHPARWLSLRSAVVAGCILFLGLGAGWWAGRGDASGENGVALDTSLRANGIAVLPFEGHSEAGESVDFLAFGLHDDLLTQLARIPGLMVISRTSVERYRDDPPSMPEIGRQLGVAYILEGGVQRTGDRIRMNAQLIDARTDGHLWAETFDRDLSVAEIFAIQAELAERIAGVMQTTLSKSAAPEPRAPPTESIEAWSALAAARSLASRSEDRAGTLELLERAVALDPDFAQAWAVLSVFHSTGDARGTPAIDDALRALEQARALAPDEPETLWAEGAYGFHVREADADALASLERAASLAPGDSEILRLQALVLRRMGRAEEAVEVLERAVSLDPAAAGPGEANDSAEARRR